MIASCGISTLPSKPHMHPITSALTLKRLAHSNASSACRGRAKYALKSK